MTDSYKLIPVLAGGGVEFVMVGGVAASIHGSARLTQALDIVYRRTRPNVTRLASALGPYGPYLRGAPPELPFRWGEQVIWNGLNSTLSTTIGPIDLLGEITGGGGYDDLLPHSVSVQIFGFDCHCLGLERLIHVKRAAGRPRDFEAIAELETILQQTRDRRQQ